MVTPSPVLTVKTAPGIKHVSVRRFYLGPAFEMFALHVTLLPQSCRSARLLFLLRCSLSPPRPPPLYLYQPLFLSRSLPSSSVALSSPLNVGQCSCSADSIQLLHACDQLVNINVQWQIHCGQTLPVFVMWISHGGGSLIIGLLLPLSKTLCLQLIAVMKLCGRL